jgi:hypothetical protein
MVEERDRPAGALISCAITNRTKQSDKRESSGVERSDKVNAQQYRCEAGLRAEQRASSAENDLSEFEAPWRFRSEATK